MQVLALLRPAVPLWSDFLPTHSMGETPGWETWMSRLGTLPQSGAAKAACEPTASSEPKSIMESVVFFIDNL
jgi:hypothetical protein